MTLEQEPSPDDKFASITINVRNFQPGATVKVTVGAEGDGPSAAWSSGRDFANASGLTLSSTGDALPLSRFQVTNKILTFTTASGGGGGDLSLSCRLWVVAPLQLTTFTLTATADTSTKITGTLEGQNARTIEEASPFTPTSWS